MALTKSSPDIAVQRTEEPEPEPERIPEPNPSPETRN